MTTLFISDLHLDASEPAAGAQFIEFLRQRAANAEALYILGDLFESWVGDDDEDAHRNRICEALAELAARDVPCYVMHGNRDFLLQSGFEARTGTRVIDDPLLIDLYGAAVLLTHGDALCTGDQAYQRLRSIVRAPRWQRRFLALPLAVRRGLAERARAGSRQHVQRTAYEIMDVDESAVAAVMRDCEVGILIHGHTHRPAVHEFELDGRRAQRIVLGAWHEHGSCLSWGPEGFALETLPRVATPLSPISP